MFINNFINQYGTTILYTVIMAIISYLGLLSKKFIKNYYTNKTTKEVVEIVCKMVEKLYPELSHEEKIEKILKNTNEMLSDKEITPTELELRMLISSTIDSLQKIK